MLTVIILLTVGATTGCGAGSWDGGIHARFGWSETSGLRVIEVPEGPAKRAGLQVGETIVRVDGEELEGMNQDAIHALLRGPVGSTVRLSVLREPEPVEVEIERAPYVP